MSENPPDPFGRGEDDELHPLLRWHLHMVKTEQVFFADMMRIEREHHEKMRAIDMKWERKVMTPTVMLAVLVGTQVGVVASQANAAEAARSAMQSALGLGIGWLLSFGFAWMAKRAQRKAKT